MTKVMNCNCVNVQQDALHGEGRRVFNRTAKGDGKTYRCTSCSTDRVHGESLTSTKKKKK